MRRIISVVLSAVMCISLLPTIVMAKTSSGICGENITWSYSGGTLTLSGYGDMKFTVEGYPPWFDYSFSGISEIIIDEGITSIDDFAFCGCRSVKSIQLPSSIKKIGKSAFSSSGIESIEIPYGITEIPEQAFESSALKSITLPYSIKNIGGRAFYKCNKLEEIYLPNSVVSIGNSAFYECTTLEEIHLSENVSVIEDGAFYKCSKLIEIDIPDATGKIGASAFSGCTNLKNLTISQNVKYIGAHAFTNTKWLANQTADFLVVGDNVLLLYQGSSSTVSIPNYINYIADGAFQENEILKYVFIPDSVKYIGNSAFYFCTNLKKINIPYSVSYIGSSAFDFCKSLESIVIPSSIKKIEYRTFSCCYSLTNVSLPEGLENLGSNAFAGCNNLKNISIPDTVTDIDTAFRGCDVLENISIPKEQTEIKGYAFNCDYNLKYIIIPSTVKSIGDSAFWKCTSLTDVYYSGSQEEWNNVSIGKSNECLTNATIHFNSFGPKICAKYKSGLIKNAFLDFDYSDSYFIDNNGYTYNHNLARATLALELSSFTADDDAMKNINELYDKLGFKDNIVPYNYDKSLDDNSDKAAYSFASKRLYDGSTLVAVVVRGGEYGAEWRSNFHVGLATKHIGFNTPAEEIYQNLQSYINSKGYDTNNTKIWITGYSRGAAIANLVSGKINETGLINRNNLYSYLFAVPNGVFVSAHNANNSIHNNIYNIVLPYDVVPKVALERWGFGKYGKILLVKDRDISSEYINNNEQYFYSLTKTAYNLKKYNTKSADKIIDAIYELSNTSIKYALLYEGAIMDLVEWGLYRKDRYNQSLFNFAIQKYRKEQGYSEAVEFDCSLYTLCKGIGIDVDTQGIGIILYMNEVNTLALANDFVRTFYMKFVGLLINGRGLDFNAHHPEYYISWLYGYDNPKDIYETSTYKKLTIACPVNVNVYDSYGDLVASVVDNEVVVDILPIEVIGESAEIYFYDDEDIDDYKIEIVAYDEGIVNYSISEYTNNGTEARKINYSNVPVEVGTTLSGNIPKGQSLDAEVYNLTATTNEEKMVVACSNDLSGDDLQNLSVLVEIEGDGTAHDVLYVTQGELITLEAEPYFDADFIGWYDEENNLLSSDIKYSFIIENNISLTAKFSRCSAKLEFDGVPLITNDILNVKGMISVEKNINGRCFVALYSNDSSLLSVKLTDVALSDNTQYPIDEDFDISLYKKAPSYVKLFLWEDMKQLCPYNSVSILPIVNTDTVN